MEEREVKILPKISCSFSGCDCVCFWLETDVEGGVSELIYTREWQVHQMNEGRHEREGISLCHAEQTLHEPEISLEP